MFARGILESPAKPPMFASPHEWAKSIQSRIRLSMESVGSKSDAEIVAALRSIVAATENCPFLPTREPLPVLLARGNRQRYPGRMEKLPIESRPRPSRGRMGVSDDGS